MANPNNVRIVGSKQNKYNLFNYYLAQNMNKVCRICLEQSNKLIPIFDPVKPPHFSVLIMACTSVKVQKGDGLPPCICRGCISRLNTAFEFKTQCEASDSKLQDLLNKNSITLTVFEYSVLCGVTKEIKNKINHTHIDNIPEVAQYANKENSEQKSYIEEQSDANHYDTNIKTIKIESLEEVDQYNINNESQKEFKVEQDVCEEQMNIEVKIEDLNYGHTIDNSTNNTKKTSEPLKMLYQCKTCKKGFKMKTHLIAHMRAGHTGEGPYSCHLCHKSFIISGHLHTHMKGHMREKNRGDLIRHTITVHPLKRPYYPKRFIEGSANRNAHIKFHKRKKNHSLVHTEKKEEYLCEYCAISYKREYFLMRHLRLQHQQKETVK